MPTYGGKGVNGKIIKVKPYDTEGSDKFLPLTERQRGLLLALTEFLDWKTRWISFPDGLDDDDTRDAYVSDLKNRLMQMVNICEEMIACIESDGDVITSLVNFFKNQLTNNTEIQQLINQITQTSPGSEPTITKTGENIYTETGGCDYDNLYGAMLIFVRWMNYNNVDFLEKMVAAVTPADRATALSNNIPNFNGGIFGDVLSDIFTFFSGAFKSNYEATYDTTYETGLVCELFCLARANCTISTDDLYALFSARVGYNPNIGDRFLQGLTFAVTGTWTGENICDIMMFCQVAAFAFMGGFLSFRGLNALSNAMTSGYDQPDNDWENCLCVVEAFIPASEPCTTNGGGFDTTFDVESGKTYWINPVGAWDGGAGGLTDARGLNNISGVPFLVPTARDYRMVFRVDGEDIWAATADDFYYTATATGRLYAGCNDVPGTYGDNSGFIRITPVEIP